MADVELSESGAPIYRHKPRETAWEAPNMSDSSLEAISDHIEKHLGPIAMVYHELISDLVHIDVHHVAPSTERPHHTLVTSGMSDRPMSAPPGAEAFRFGELMLALPPTWPLTQEAFRDERNYWPVRWLKMLARMPHEYQTWLSYGHTVPNGDPPEPFCEGVGFVGMLLELPLTAGSDFASLQVREDKTIHFWSLVPLYPEEMALKLRRGTEHLEALFDKYHINDLVEVGRRNVARKRFGIF